MSSEVKNLKQEIDQRITEKKDAMDIVATLFARFDLTVQDFIDRLVEIKYTGRE